METYSREEVVCELPLTPRQKAILDYIVRYRAEKDCTPTIREIGKEFKIASTNGVIDHLRRIEAKGYISVPRMKARSIGLTDKGKTAYGIQVLEKMLRERIAELEEESAELRARMNEATPLHAIVNKDGEIRQALPLQYALREAKRIGGRAVPALVVLKNNKS